MRRVSHDEHTAAAHLLGIGVVDRPGVRADQIDVQLRVADKLPRDIRRHRLVHQVVMD